MRTKYELSITLHAYLRFPTLHGRLPLDDPPNPRNKATREGGGEVRACDNTRKAKTQK